MIPSIEDYKPTKRQVNCICWHADKSININNCIFNKTNLSSFYMAVETQAGKSDNIARKTGVLVMEIIEKQSKENNWIKGWLWWERGQPEFTVEVP